MSESKPLVTAEQLARICAEFNPSMSFAYHNDTAVGVWTEEAGQFLACYSRTILDDRWIDLGNQGLPLVNGKNVIPDNEWVEVLGPIRQGIVDGIEDGWTISNKPRTNGYTEDVYCAIKERVENFDFDERVGKATPYQISYLDGFDAVALKRGFTEKEEYD